MYAQAYIEVDIDYPGEGNNAIEKAESKARARWRGKGIKEVYGIQYDGYAKVEGRAPKDNQGKSLKDYVGEWECYALVPNKADHKPRQTWRGKVEEDVHAKDFIELDMNPPGWAALRAQPELSSCTAWGEVTGECPKKERSRLVATLVGKDSQKKIKWVKKIIVIRAAMSHRAYANVWNFGFNNVRNPKPPPEPWQCYLSGDTSCSACE